jgi:cell wall-associated NlpC family hydrolase
MAKAEKYVGIEYAEGVRDGEGPLDCWGLVRLVMRKEYRKELPGFEEVVFVKERKHEMVDGFSKAMPLIDSVKVETPEPGDIIVMKTAGLPIHTGIMMDDGLVLHCEPHIGAVAVRFDSVDIQKRLSGVYRVN